MNEFENMVELISGCQPNFQEKDRMWWFLGEEGDFTVKELKMIVDEKVLMDYGDEKVTRWNM